MGSQYAAGVRIFMKDGKLWRHEGIGNESVPTVRLTRDELQVGCTRITREAFKFLMNAAQAFWNGEGKII